MDESLVRTVACLLQDLMGVRDDDPAKPLLGAPDAATMARIVIETIDLERAVTTR